MADRTCLTCKHEPEWGNWSNGEYSYCTGKCRWPVNLPAIKPSVYSINVRPVMRFKDDSGIERRCKAWEPKDA